jgi:hypothetical protein
MMGTYIIIGIFILSLLLHYIEYKQNYRMKYIDFIRSRYRKIPKTTNILSDYPNLLLLTNAILINLYIETHLAIHILLVLVIILVQKSLIYLLLKLGNLLLRIKR